MLHRVSRICNIFRLFRLKQIETRILIATQSFHECYVEVIAQKCIYDMREIAIPRLIIKKI